MVSRKPINAVERRLDRWLLRSGFMRLLLWISAALCIVLAVKFYRTSPSTRHIPSILSIVYAIGALAVARHMGNFQRPSIATWLAGLSFMLPLMLYVAQFTGVLDPITRLAHLR